MWTKLGIEAVDGAIHCKTRVSSAKNFLQVVNYSCLSSLNTLQFKEQRYYRLFFFLSVFFLKAPNGFLIPNEYYLVVGRNEPSLENGEDSLTGCPRGVLLHFMHI